MIDRLQQLERVKLMELLEDYSIWHSLDIDYHPPHVERLWCQLGKYRLYLHFIHPCTREQALFHPHPWPSVIHVIEGEYEMGMGYGTEEPEIFSTILSQGSMYYEMPHRDGWHYVRPTKSVCSSIMLTGEPWGREMPSEEEVEILGGLHNDRVIVMLEYFKSKFQHTVNSETIQNIINKGDWVGLDESKMDQADKSEFGHLIGQRGFVIKNSQQDGICLRFGNDRYDDFEPDILMKISKPEK